VIVVALFGATAADGDGEGQGRATDWRLGYDQKFDAQLNPFLAQLGSSYFVFTETYDLLPYNWGLADAGPDPDHSLVTSHEVSEDGLEYTFHLREGVRWSDGEDFTADDFVFSYEAVKNATSANVLAGYVTSMRSIEKIDDYTVRYTLKRPDARVLTAFVPALPEHIWGDVPLDELSRFDPCCPMVGTGPYVIASEDDLDPKGTTILTPNEYFWGEPGQIERILMIKYGDKEAQLRDIQLNSLDAVLSGSSSWVPQLETDPSVEAWAAPSPGFTSIAFNLCPPQDVHPDNTCTGPAEGVNTQVVQDLAIRQAMQWAIDRQNLVDTVYFGQATPGNGFISPYYKRYFQSYEGDPEIGYTYDPDRARQILAEGGWACPENGVCTKDGQPATFELLVRSENQEDQNAARRIVAWAADVGIEIELSVISEDALLARNYPESPEDKNKYEPDYDAFLWGWGGDLPSPDFNFEVTLCGSSWSDTFYCNPEEYDPLPEAALRSLDFQERVDLMHRSERIVLRDSPYLILVHDALIYLTRTDTWAGYVASPEPDGAPFSTSWLQLQIVRPGQAASSNYAGAPIALGGLALFVVAAFLASRWRRRREESGPLELAPPADDGRSILGDRVAR
jgi:peptide/nickel transport system substrate-binding protein